MKHKLFEELEIYNFSGCREITGSELYSINGGGRRESANNNNQTDSSPTSSPDSYTVQSGDTLSQIVYDYNQANGTNLTVNEVAQLSGIENPDLIHPGQSIVFGTPSESNNSESPTTQSSPSNIEGHTNAYFSTNSPVLNNFTSAQKTDSSAMIYTQNSNLNKKALNYKTNKPIGNILLDKLAGTLSRFLSPNSITIDMTPNTKITNLKVVTPKYVVDNNIQEFLSGNSKLLENQEYIKQGALGVGEIGLGVGIWVGTTFLAINAEVAALEKGQPVDASVGSLALSGYAGGTVYIADGVRLLSSAFCKERIEPVSFSLIKDLFFSSPYQDIGEAIKIYKDSL